MQKKDVLLTVLCMRLLHRKEAAYSRPFSLTLYMLSRSHYVESESQRGTPAFMDLILTPYASCV